MPKKQGYASGGGYSSGGRPIESAIGTKVMRENFRPEPTKFVQATDVKTPNMGQAIPKSKLTSDQPSFTGKEQGFFAKFGSKGVDK